MISTQSKIVTFSTSEEKIDYLLDHKNPRTERLIRSGNYTLVKQLLKEGYIVLLSDSYYFNNIQLQGIVSHSEDAVVLANKLKERVRNIDILDPNPDI